MYTYNIDYNDYNANLCDGLQSILASSEMSDVTFAVDGKYFKAHQVILSMFSTYFRDLFNAAPSRNTIFFMKNAKHRIMKNILTFMYEGKVQIPSEDFQLFVETANELKIKGLVSDTNLETTVPAREPVYERPSTSQVSDLDLLRNRSVAAEHELKYRVDNDAVPISSEMSVFPYSSGQTDSLEIEESDAFDLVKPDIDDIESTEVTGLNENTIELDHKMPGSTRMVEDTVTVNNAIMDIGHESIQETEGEPVLVSLCLSRTTQKVKGVIWDDFRYYMLDRRGGYTRWRCTAHGARKCYAKLFWSDGGLITVNQRHNHSKCRIYQQASTNVVSRTLHAVSYENFRKKFFIYKGRKVFMNHHD